MSITTKIKSFEDACAALGLDPQQEIPYPQPASGRQRGINASAKLFIIAEALNEGWKPNWYNWDEYKYYPWFDLSTEKKRENDGPAGGSGFSFHGYVFVRSGSRVGSRLVFRTRELAEFAGKQFIDIYNTIQL